jgi:tRNA G18 (ribose-2'-O)-methylase SpoU
MGLWLDAFASKEVVEMPIQRIESAGDPGVALFREVPDAERLRSQGLFVAEGRLIVARILEDARYRVRAALVNEASYRQLATAFDRLSKDVPIFVADRTSMLDLTGHDLHRGCLALVERPPMMSAQDVLASAGTVVVLEGISNADNVGGVFRNAAAFGAAGVLLSPTCCDPLYRKSIRTSMGAALRVPFARLDEWPAALGEIRAAGFTLAALTPREPAESLSAFSQRPRAERIALLVGTEGAGLSAAAEGAADHRVRIPTSDAVDSLNVAVAVGIALHALRDPQRT